MIVRPTFTLLSLCLIGGAAAAPEKKTVDGVAYHVLHSPMTSVRIIWKDKNGTPLRTFPAVSQYLKGEGLQVDTLMNGGIFEPGGVPSGLLIQNGKVLNPVNRNKGEGNFFLQPNGIFLVGSAGAAVIRTDEYPLKDTTIQQAVQSGPLLLRQGKVHPAFNANSTSRLHRNGVGVAKSGEVVFAMTDFHSPKFPNLYEFAQLFRTLGCADALFLDGDLSQMCSGADLTKDSSNFGSIIAVTRTTKVEQGADGKTPEAPKLPH
jgi:uncharacterized protein YigE (DUF2233 family)